MPSVYPGAQDAFVNPTDTDTLDTPPHDGQHADANDAIEAVQGELGLNPRGSHATVRARLDSQLGLLGSEVFEASGNFVKANWPGIKRVRVIAVGGGGGGGGGDTTAAGNTSAGGGGGGGAYAESLLDESALAASEAVTVGAGGAAGAAATTGGTQGNGGAGGDSSFGAHVIAKGADTFTTKGENARPISHGHGGPGGLASASTGDIKSSGGGGGAGFGSTDRAIGGAGGSSALGGGAEGPNTNSPAQPGNGYGGGGSGAPNGASQAGRAGGPGADGVVIVEVYGSP